MNILVCRELFVIAVNILVCAVSCYCCEYLGLCCELVVIAVNILVCAVSYLLLSYCSFVCTGGLFLVIV